MRKTIRVGLLCASLLAAGFAPASLAAETTAPAAPATGDVRAWVDEKVRATEPNAAERTFDQIAWSTDILTALELAKKNDRPIFLFTHDGRMALGRC